MNPTEQRILEESRKFRQRLPELLKTYEGRWVVFRDGGVVEAFDDEDTAYVAAVQRFGAHSGFVVAPVAADVCDPSPVTAALIFAKPAS